ncbi:TetR/AcrR family transcriptional regulator [Segetibacter koreensis]|uniref:TetR/AcrR family transcriptional regulator n=1 Tax=Segetibacter koreensis TaxID=398037 RepID=UPI0003800173|nr:TetR/AcrR family transcriptional regulator [Segetibacter koreensis]
MGKEKDLTTEQKILEAARKIFLTKGLDGARMQDIADEAGINKAMLHYYFRSKDKLFEQIFAEVAGHFLPKVLAIFESEETVFKKIETFCIEYINQINETPYVPIFILNEINRHPEEFLKKVFGNKMPPVGKIIKQLEKEQKQGIIKKVDPLQLLLNMLSLCVFPFVARPVIQLIAGMDRTQFNTMIEQRKKEVPKLIIDSIKK